MKLPVVHISFVFFSDNIVRNKELQKVHMNVARTFKSDTCVPDIESLQQYFVADWLCHIIECNIKSSSMKLLGHYLIVKAAFAYLRLQVNVFGKFRKTILID